MDGAVGLHLVVDCLAMGADELNPSRSEPRFSDGPLRRLGKMFAKVKIQAADLFHAAGFGSEKLEDEGAYSWIPGKLNIGSEVYVKVRRHALDVDHGRVNSVGRGAGYEADDNHCLTPV